MADSTRLPSIDRLIPNNFIVGTSTVDDQSFHNTGAIVDESGNGNYGVTKGAPTFVASPFGGTFTRAISTNGVDADDNSDGVISTFIPGFDTYTIEFLYRKAANTTVAGSTPMSWTSFNGGSSNNSLSGTYLIDNTNNTITAVMALNGTAVSVVSSVVLAINTNYRIAIQASAGSFSLWINGVSQGTISGTTYVTPSQRVTIGRYAFERLVPVTLDPAPVAGTFGSVRLSNVARYTHGTNYTPTTGPFTPDANTVLLWEFNPAVGETVRRTISRTQSEQKDYIDPSAVRTITRTQSETKDYTEVTRRAISRTSAESKDYMEGATSRTISRTQSEQKDYTEVTLRSISRTQSEQKDYTERLTRSLSRTQSETKDYTEAMFRNISRLAVEILDHTDPTASRMISRSQAELKDYTELPFRRVISRRSVEVLDRTITGSTTLTRLDFTGYTMDGELLKRFAAKWSQEEYAALILQIIQRGSQSISNFGD